MDKEPVERDEGEKAPELNLPAADPFTGIRPVGPVESGDAGRGRGHSGLAARWFLYALLAIAFLGILTWVFGD